MEAGSSARGSRAVRLLMSAEHAVTAVSVFDRLRVARGGRRASASSRCITRFVLQQPSTWSEPLVRTLLVWMAYLGLCGVIRAGALVSVDALYRACRGRARRVLEAVITLATLSLLLILVWYGTEPRVPRPLPEPRRPRDPGDLGATRPFPVGAAVSVLAVLAHFFDPVREELETAV